MSNKTIHIFGNGEIQVIGNSRGENASANVNTLTKVQSVIDDIFSKKPNDNTSTLSYHCINIFQGSFAQFIPSTRDNGEKSFRVKYSELNNVLIDELVLEVIGS